MLRTGCRFHLSPSSTFLDRHRQHCVSSLRETGKRLTSFSIAMPLLRPLPTPLRATAVISPLRLGLALRPSLKSSSDICLLSKSRMFSSRTTARISSDPFVCRSCGSLGSVLLHRHRFAVHGLCFRQSESLSSSLADLEVQRALLHRYAGHASLRRERAGTSRVSSV